MTTLALQHDEWHRLFGKYTTCPLDCGAGEIVDQAFEADAQALEAGAHRIRCGSCRGHHASIAMVRFCYEVKEDAKTWQRQEDAMIKALEEAEDCEHGLSAALCAGPGHYPTDL